ncbi:MAG TPA: hypothetical protein VE057_05590, partial [Archangium sp.]|nr:hypothetical protein [Archangium sp.]
MWPSVIRLGVLALVWVLAACGQRGSREVRTDGGLPVGQGGQGLGGTCAGQQSFLIGSGLHDITGPAAEVG